MTKEFSELRTTMTPTARLESAAVAAALPTQLPLHERQQELKVQVSKDSGFSRRRHDNDSLASALADGCAAREYVATYLQSDMGASMTITTLSSREFNQDTSRAKKAAQDGPVFITDRGRPAHVLLTIEAYQKLTGGEASIVDLLAMPGVEDIEFDPPRLRGPLTRPVDLT